MERIVTGEQMRLADSYTIDQLGIEESLLIERAGNAVSGEITKKFKGGRTLIVIGKGNNGKDGLIIKENLSAVHGFVVTAFFAETDDLSILERKFDIVIDCLFGTGLKKEISGRYGEIVDKINQMDAYKIACDIPSGINADNGFVMGKAIKADMTVAIQEYKLGHFLFDGADYCGTVVAKDIGISLWEENYAYRLTDDDIKGFFPNRKKNSNKGSFGKVAVIGGSGEYVGAPMLSLNAICSLKMGNGYAYLCVPKSNLAVYAGSYPECILRSFFDKDGKITYDESFLDGLLNLDAISIGSGMTISEDLYKSVNYLLKNYNGNLVIDADALNSLAKYGVDILKDKKAKVLITPHVKEFSRLCGLSVEEINADFIGSAKKFAKEYDVTVLLKSATSVITDGKRVCVNTVGTVGQAKAGSGDVLCGLAVGLSGRESVFSAGCVSAYLGGSSAKSLAKKIGNYALTPSEVISEINLTLKKLEK